MNGPNTISIHGRRVGETGGINRRTLYDSEQVLKRVVLNEKAFAIPAFKTTSVGMGKTQTVVSACVEIPMGLISTDGGAWKKLKTGKSIICALLKFLAVTARKENFEPDRTGIGRFNHASSHG